MRERRASNHGHYVIFYCLLREVYSIRSKSSRRSLYLRIFRLILDVSTQVTKSSMLRVTRKAGSETTDGPTLMSMRGLVCISLLIREFSWSISKRVRLGHNQAFTSTRSNDDHVQHQPLAALNKRKEKEYTYDPAPQR